ncbi:MAG: phenylalanine--tRNA ligase subunit beta [Candidatus Omnitrophica bacterium]|nr:phenylalanine--tRNA ligase subunit beta [Candidatus Omnitrophota bacterium]
MKISYNWLREYVDVKNSPQQVAEWLTMAGLEVTSLEKEGKDTILEIEVTTNRPDWLSVIGVAREISAITGKHLKIPKVQHKSPIVRNRQIKVEIQDKILCPRYTARIIEDVHVGPSPQWLKGFLEAVGIRSINNVVDITNFCLIELGQPLHAFDYDKLIGQTIIVRKAKKGERIVTIDKAQRELDSDTLIIADEKRPVAIAGIMGGVETEVSESTKTVLVESAYFDSISIRRAQRKFGLTTDSSYRFERGVDLEGVLFASDRAAGLMAEVCGGKIGILKDVGTKAAKTNYIRLSLDKANKILNLNLPPIAVKRILENLGLKVAGAQKEMRIEVPSFRRDLKNAEDLIEEIARMHGYDKIPTTIPKMVGHVERKAFQRTIEESVREILIAEGLDEVINYSLVSQEDLKILGLGGEDVILIKNPLSKQQEAMRPSLIPCMLNVARFNINRKIEDLSIFELSKVYFASKDKKYKEETALCMLSSGKSKNDWRQKRSVDFFEIKGLVETLFDRLGVTNYEFSNSAQQIFYTENSANILVDKIQVGIIGGVKKTILDNFDIKKEIFLCEIKFEKLLEFINIEKRFAILPKFLSVKRDISLIVEKNIYVKDLFNVIKEAGGDVLKGVELSDEYFGEQIPTGKRGLTFSIEYLDVNKQLTDEQIEETHNKIKQALIGRAGAKIR